MKKDYWYIENEQEIGPFNLNEFLEKKLSDETIVWFEGLSEWTEYKNVKSQIKKTNNVTPNKKKNKKPIFISFLVIMICTLSIGGYFLYEKYSFKEEDAKNAVVKFYEMIRSGHNNVDKKLYPDYNKIGTLLVIQKNYKIKEIIKNEAGEYEVYTEYLHDVKETIPISFIVHKEKGQVKIKSSRGISYSFYDNTYEYGMRKKLFKGNETDAEIGKLDRKYHISKQLDSELEWELILLRMILTARVSLQNSNYGLLMGTIEVTNGSEYDLEWGDFDCKVNYYDDYANIIDSDPIYVFSGLRSGENFSKTFYPSRLLEFSSCSAEIDLKESDSFKSKIRKRIIENSFK